MVLPDHPTPLSTRTHSSDPVPFVIFSSKKFESNHGKGHTTFSEKEALSSELYIKDGHKLLESMLNNKF